MKALLLALALLATPAAHFDRTVHDFGEVLLKDGPQSCVFTLLNEGGDPVNILAVIPSCGCTDVKWTRESIPAGGKGTVSVIYANDDGPYPFDKTLTVYLSDIKKPVILHIRGVAKNK